MAFDDLAKQLFKSNFGEAIETNVTAGALEKTFDILVKGTHPLIQNAKYLPGLFKQYEYNLIEYKSEHDSYRLFDILKLIGDFGYFGANRQCSVSFALERCCLWFVISNPARLNQESKNERLLQPLGLKGYYHFMNCTPKLILLNLEECEAAQPQNAILMLLANASKFQEFIQQNYKDDELFGALRKYINIKLLLEGTKVKNVSEVQEAKKRLHYRYEQGIRESIEELGIDKVIAAVGIDKVIAAVGIDKVLNTIGTKEVAKYIKESSNQKEIEEIISILQTESKSEKGKSKKAKK